jgi:hypothetical protein
MRARGIEEPRAGVPDSRGEFSTGTDTRFAGRRRSRAGAQRAARRGRGAGLSCARAASPASPGASRPRSRASRRWVRARSRSPPARRVRLPRSARPRGAVVDLGPDHDAGLAAVLPGERAQFAPFVAGAAWARAPSGRKEPRPSSSSGRPRRAARRLERGGYPPAIRQPTTRGVRRKMPAPTSTCESSFLGAEAMQQEWSPAA